MCGEAQPCSNLLQAYVAAIHLEDPDGPFTCVHAELVTVNVGADKVTMATCQSLNSRRAASQFLVGFCTLILDSALMSRTRQVHISGQCFWKGAWKGSGQRDAHRSEKSVRDIGFPHAVCNKAVCSSAASVPPGFFKPFVADHLCGL